MITVHCVLHGRYHRIVGLEGFVERVKATLRVQDPNFAVVQEAPPEPKTNYKWMNGAWALDLEKVTRGLERVISNYLDSKAREYGFDNILSASSYMNDTTVPAWKAEAERLQAWRSSVWLQAEVIKTKVEQGEIPVPTASELVGMLPLL